MSTGVILEGSVPSKDHRKIHNQLPRYSTLSWVLDVLITLCGAGVLFELPEKTIAIFVVVFHTVLLVLKAMYYLETYRPSHRSKFTWNRTVEYVPLVFVILQLLELLVVILITVFQFADLQWFSILAQIPLSVVCLIILLCLLTPFQVSAALGCAIIHRLNSVTQCDVSLLMAAADTMEHSS